jgi:hypothetical protein
VVPARRLGSIYGDSVIDDETAINPVLLEVERSILYDIASTEAVQIRRICDVERGVAERLVTGFSEAVVTDTCVDTVWPMALIA